MISNSVMAADGKKCCPCLGPHCACSRWAVPFPWDDVTELVLRETFCLPSFRPPQRAVINAIISSRDVFCHFPTGYGKTLLYQLPSVCRVTGVTIVVVPLLSLLQDLRRRMYHAGIRAAGIHSGLTDDERKTVRDALLSNEVRVLLLTPEQLGGSQRFQDFVGELYRKGRIRLFVFDEAHCILHSCPEFRPLYGSMNLCREAWSTVPILAMTATATTGSEAKIIASLGMTNVVSFRMSNVRSNLYIDVRPREADFISSVLPTLKKSFDAPLQLRGLLYTTTPASVSVLVPELTAAGFSVSGYHGEMSTDERLRIHEKWHNGASKLMVATSSFGLGIDEPDVRFVIVYGAPRSIEDLVQFFGRAGRDGNNAVCIVGYSYADHTTWVNIHFPEYGGSEPSPFICEQMRAVHETISFCQNNLVCRRLQLHQHFSPYPTAESLSSVDADSGSQSLCCDVCSSEPIPSHMIDTTSVLPLFLDFLVKYTPPPSEAVTRKAANVLNRMDLNYVLRGSECKQVREEWKKHRVFGVCKGFSFGESARLLSLFLCRGYYNKNAYSSRGSDSDRCKRNTYATLAGAIPLLGDTEHQLTRFVVKQKTVFSVRVRGTDSESHPEDSEEKKEDSLVSHRTNSGAPSDWSTVRCSKTDLRKLCVLHKLKTSGNKPVLMQRLIDAKIAVPNGMRSKTK